MPRHAEISWELINRWINVHLKTKGIDPSREMRTWGKLAANGTVILMFEQADDAGPVNTENTQVMHSPKPNVPVTGRPSYLEKYK